MSKFLVNSKKQKELEPNAKTRHSHKTRENHSMQKLLMLSLSLLMSSTSCHKTKAPDNQKSKGELSYEDTVNMCVKLHQEMLQCPAEFVSMNIDLRVQYSPEFAQMMSDPATRAEAEKVGLEETKNDGGAAAQGQCQEYAKPSWGPPTTQANAAALDDCYKLTSCSEQMACIRPQIEPRFRYRAEQEKKK
jgi:hypothetical protein